MRGEGIFAVQMGALFATACRKSGLTEELPPLSAAAFHRPPGRADGIVRLTRARLGPDPLPSGVRNPDRRN
jgi:hypothetical protein